eukprot:TRINITY_DN1925_c0_g2_i1.p1 TRINITY_DN1925_c0_g2~~TRINITY_DN1925_c0_g2_i1.p1  ORF type:complete len:455 (-),score=149.23 TRINITY_DN1925_c0_g2_i1:1176-2345(-)
MKVQEKRSAKKASDKEEEEDDDYDDEEEEESDADDSEKEDDNENEDKGEEEEEEEEEEYEPEEDKPSKQKKKEATKTKKKYKGKKKGRKPRSEMIANASKDPPPPKDKSKMTPKQLAKEEERERKAKIRAEKRAAKEALAAKRAEKRKRLEEKKKQLQLEQQQILPLGSTIGDLLKKSSSSSSSTKPKSSSKSKPSKSIRVSNLITRPAPDERPLSLLIPTFSSSIFDDGIEEYDFDAETRDAHKVMYQWLRIRKPIAKEKGVKYVHSDFLPTIDKCKLCGQGESSIDKSYLPTDPHVTLHIPKKEKLTEEFDIDNLTFYDNGCTIPLLKAVKLENENVFLNVGGSVWAMDWCSYPIQLTSTFHYCSDSHSLSDSLRSTSRSICSNWCS